MVVYSVYSLLGYSIIFAEYSFSENKLNMLTRMVQLYIIIY